MIQTLTFVCCACIVLLLNPTVFKSQHNDDVVVVMMKNLCAFYGHFSCHTSSTLQHTRAFCLQDTNSFGH